MNDQTPIFILSLPRSGSTLLQRILASHPLVATGTEPHFMLPLIRSLQEWGTYSEYEHQMSTFAIQEFCDEYLPNGRADYFDAIRLFADHVYSCASPNNEPYFLDKTPRYHAVLGDLMDIYQNGKFIFLWRHPLSVVASMSSTFYKSRWFTYVWEYDLYKGVDQLIDPYLAHRDRALGIRYEDLIDDPIRSLDDISTYLGIDYDQDALETFGGIEMKGHYRDPYADLEQYKKLQGASVDKWKEFFSNPLRKRWARKYLRWIGAERLAVMGYDLELLLAEVDAIPSSKEHLLADAIRMPYGNVSRVFESHLVRDKVRQLRRGERQVMLK